MFSLKFQDGLVNLKSVDDIVFDSSIRGINTEYGFSYAVFWDDNSFFTISLFPKSDISMNIYNTELILIIDSKIINIIIISSESESMPSLW